MTAGVLNNSRGKNMAYKMNTRRKLAIATWSSPKEGNVYGRMNMDMTDTLKYIDYIREKTGEKITITHIVGKAAGVALAQTPDINGRIVMGKYVPHNSVDLSFLVVIGKGEDLAKVKVSNIDQKSLADVAKALRHRAEKLRDGEDDEFNKSKPILKLLPTWMLRPIIHGIGYLTGALGVSVPSLGLEAFPFGACIVTSVGMFGLDEGFAAPTPFARVPVYLAVMKIQDQPVVVDGKVEVRKMLGVTATIDHRFLDGYQGAMLANVVRKCGEQPWTMEGEKRPQDLDYR